MAIPPLNEHGWLPEGIHNCTPEETAKQFGMFQGSDRRPLLWAKFVEFVREAKACGLIDAILVDGSFVTAEPTRMTSTSYWWCPQTMTFRWTSDQANITSYLSGESISALASISWSHVPTLKNIVVMWSSFNKSDWNRGVKRAY